jgi:hypothetical protein
MDNHSNKVTIPNQLEAIEGCRGDGTGNKAELQQLVSMEGTAKRGVKQWLCC